MKLINCGFVKDVGLKTDLQKSTGFDLVGQTRSAPLTEYIRGCQSDEELQKRTILI